MSKFSTQSKLTLAKLLHRLIVTARRLVGLNAQCVTRRGGVCWDLDLDEGIDLAIYLKLFERETLSTIPRLVKNGATVLDIGANIGALTLPLAKAVGETGRVIAFEPTVWALAKLKRNISINEKLAPRIKVEHCMLLASTANCSVPELISSSWSLVSKNSEQPTLIDQGSRGLCKPTTGANLQTLNQYVKSSGLKKIDLIKLDVDGYELDVIEGGLEVLSQFKPKIIIEIAVTTSDPENKNILEVIKKLHNLGYRFRRLASNSRYYSNAGSILADCPKGGGGNFLAEIPEPQLLQNAA
jgi:FkbM family methyltransferase